jgi:hypothetical protein
MNKARRQELKKLKYKKRLIKMGYWNENTSKSPKGKGYNFTGFLNSSKPCSCSVCRHQKYNRNECKANASLLDSQPKQDEPNY